MKCKLSLYITRTNYGKFAETESWRERREKECVPGVEREREGEKLENVFTGVYLRIQKPSPHPLFKNTHI